MHVRRGGRLAVCGLATLVALSLVPGIVDAHDVTGQRFAAPIPLSLLLAGAGATVALTALGVALEGPGGTRSGRRHLLTIPAAVARPARFGAAALFLAAVAAAVVAGLLGRQVAAANPATVFTWPVWFRGLALLAVLVGTPWRTLSPWRTIHRGLVRLEGGSAAVARQYPARLGSWPAVVGFVVLIGVVETLTVVPRSPRLTAVVVATYALAMVGGATLFGATWLRRADPLGVLYGLLGRVAPVDLSRTDDGGYDVAVRLPWCGVVRPVGDGALVAFVVAAVYTVSFDGFANTRTFQAVLFGVRDALGTGPGTSVLLYAFGLGGFVAAFAAVCWLAERLGSTAGDDWRAAARRFAPTVLPIAAAYEVAHNYPYVLRSLGDLVVLALEPTRPGLGPVDPLAWLSLPTYWASQVALVVLGHLVAVVAAHHVAVDRYDAVAAARRGHLPFVVLMVGYTVLSLWIVSRPLVAG